MKKWTILPEEEEEDDEEELRDKEGTEFLAEDISNIITDEPTSFRRISSDTNPFLESSPIENLEQDIQPIPATTTIVEEEESAVNYAAAPTVTNAPEYSAAGDYDQPQRREDVQRDVSGGALTMRDEFARAQGLSLGGGMDFRTWQRSHAEGGQRVRSPEDQVGRTQRLSTDTQDPFERKSDYVP